ncbi:MAG: peptidoglycan DD-metalloendopeptidase family protein [Candidatus Rokubacteria bacterium]|nr:peptidoglycan DD-metalloendopeptidase family protein [Candidatus Rokubacteria bacterium]
MKTWLLVVLLLLLAVVGTVSFLGWRQSVPGVVSLTAPPRIIGQKTPLTVTLQASRGGVARAEVRLVQGGKATVVARQEGALGRRVEIPVTLESAALGLREGGATLEVWGRDDFWRPLRFDDRAIATYPITVDLTPPRLELLAATRYVSPGGAGLVAFRVSGALRAAVVVGGRELPSFAHGPAEGGARVALIALPWDHQPGVPLTLTAQDEAGNTASRAIPAELTPRRFPTDTIELQDAFLTTKVPELLPQRPPSQPLLDAFLTINREQRRWAEDEKRRLGTTTAEKPLWEGPFVQPKNSKVFANFAETRAYMYQGREVDRQVHYGYDLASVKQSPVPAANTGVVAFAGPLTIYGNTVIVDHGWGLQTLYAHLSRIDVKVGDAVEKGQELGRTGTTGLAIGDHLHYEVLVHGVSVTPLEWWDARWIRDHIGKPLKEAGLPAINGVEAADEPPARPAARSTRRRAR